jgi:hypothetical protein
MANEVCDDGLNNDCDGDTDEFCTSTEPTDSGIGVVVSFPYNNEITFDNVTSAGDTTVEILSSDSSPPVNFNLQSQYYEISTTATYSGPITVCFGYDDSGLSEAEELALQLLHYETDDWVDITIPPPDTVNNEICGLTNSFSPFVVVLPETPTGTTVIPIPDNSTPGSGDTVCAQVNVTDVTDLYAASFDISYDPLVLDYTGTTEGSFLSQDTKPTSMQAAPLNNEESTGQIVVGVTRLGDVGGVSGSGNLATVCFNVTGSSCATSDIILGDASLEGPAQDSDIPATWYGDSIDVMLAAPINLLTSDPGLYNRIDLSWDVVTDAAGYEVYRSDSSGGTFESLDTPSSASYQDADCIIPTLAYYYQVKATNGATCVSYLSLEVSGTVAGLLGDINNDGRVDGRDLSQLARAFGTSSDCLADLNRTDLTDGGDLSLLAANFGQAL